MSTGKRGVIAALLLIVSGIAAGVWWWRGEQGQHDDATLILYGNVDIRRVERDGHETASFTSAIQHSSYFAPVMMADMRQAEAALRARRVDGIVRLRADFARQLGPTGGSSIQVIVNGVDANTARLVVIL